MAMISKHNDFSVRAWTPREWRYYRKIRLQALACDRDAFASTLEVESAKNERYWYERLLEGCQSTRDLPLRGEWRGRCVSLGWGSFDWQDPTTACVFQMWTAPQARGRGFGSAILRRLVDWAADANAERITLSVTLGNEDAHRLYRNCNFRDVGGIEPLREGSSLKVQNMTRDLSARAAS